MPVDAHKRSKVEKSAEKTQKMALNTSFKFFYKNVLNFVLIKKQVNKVFLKRRAHKSI